jgi:putative ABC transport system permease protein
VPDNLDGEMSPVIYTALRHNPDNFITYGLRTTQNPAAIVGEVRNALREMNAQLPLYQPETMEQVMARSPSVFLRRYPSYLIGCFAALALILACVGLYGLISYSVAQRTREMGIRMALGAQQRDLLRMVMGQGARLAIAGVAIGVAAALALTRLMSSLLYGVKTWDPVTFMGVAIVLVGVALAACYLPARRAMNVDPMVALRHE